MLFALLALLAPTFAAPLSGNELGEYVSAPTRPWSDAAITVSATLGAAEDFEEEADQEVSTFLALSMLHCASDDKHQATNAWRYSFPHLSVHSCTGPPTV